VEEIGGTSTLLPAAFFLSATVPAPLRITNRNRWRLLYEQQSSLPYRLRQRILKLGVPSSPAASNVCCLSLIGGPTAVTAFQWGPYSTNSMDNWMYAASSPQNSALASGGSTGASPEHAAAGVTSSLSAIGGANSPDPEKSTHANPRIRRRNRLITSCLECRRRCVRYDRSAQFRLDRVVADLLVGS
jgi:hypothetical protein